MTRIAKAAVTAGITISAMRNWFRVSADWVAALPSNPTQSAETLTQLRIADIVIPAVTAALAILVMWNYDLTEEKAREIKTELEERRGAL